MAKKIPKPVELDKPHKKVVSKIGVELGHPYREIGSILGVGAATIGRYAREKVPLNLKQFEMEVRELFTEQKLVLSAQCIARLQKLVPTERRISEVVKAAEYAEGKGETPQASVNILNIIAEQKRKYGI